MNLLPFASLAYLEEARCRTNADRRYLALVRGETTSYTFILEPDPKWNVRKPSLVGFSVRRGRIVDVWEGERPTEFALCAPYGRWVALLGGKLDLQEAYFTRTIDVRGDLQRLVALIRPTLRWLSILRSIPTEFRRPPSRGAPSPRRSRTGTRGP